MPEPPLTPPTPLTIPQPRQDATAARQLHPTRTTERPPRTSLEHQGHLGHLVPPKPSYHQSRMPNTPLQAEHIPFTCSLTPHEPKSHQSVTVSRNLRSMIDDIDEGDWSLGPRMLRVMTGLMYINIAMVCLDTPTHSAHTSQDPHHCEQSPP